MQHHKIHNINCISGMTVETVVTIVMVETVVTDETVVTGVRVERT